jgi:hypothetical protein
MSSDTASTEAFLPAGCTQRIKICLWLSLAMSALLLAYRLDLSVSLRQPLLVLTSGWEEESLNALWKFKHGHPVYPHVTAIPYSASYFNWLFYYFYGTVIRLASHALGLSDDWIPTIARLTTLVGCFIGIVSLYRAFGLCGVSGKRLSPTLRVLLAATCMVNLLSSTWSITARPDQWAMTLELLALTLFLTRGLDDAAPLYWTILTGLILYLAWSFKQNHLGYLGGLELYLLTRRRYTQSLALLVSFAPLAIGTWLLGTEDMRYMILLSQKNLAFKPLNGIVLLSKAIAKTPWLLLAIVFMRRVRGADSNDLGQQRQIACQTVFLATFGWMFLLSCKQGANDNYFLTSQAIALLYLAFILCASEQVAVNASRRYWIEWGLCIGLALSAIEALLLMRHPARLISEDCTQLARQLQHPPLALQGPILVDGSNALNLPWVIRRDVGFVVAYGYTFDRDKGMAFEQGGIEGLIRSGYFGVVVVLRKQVPAYTAGRALAAYTLGYSNDDFNYYIRGHAAPK